jgi:hypothetical protein
MLSIVFNVAYSTVKLTGKQRFSDQWGSGNKIILKVELLPAVGQYHQGNVAERSLYILERCNIVGENILD